MKSATFFALICILSFTSSAQSNFYIGANYGLVNGISATNDNGAALNSSFEIYANMDIERSKNVKLMVGYNYIRENKNFLDEYGNSIWFPNLRRVHGSSNIHSPFVGIYGYKDYGDNVQAGLGSKLGFPFYYNQRYTSEGKDISQEFDVIPAWSGITCEIQVFGQFPILNESISLKPEWVLGYAGQGFEAHSSLGYIGARLGLVYHL